ncbi:MAG: DUF4387 domain-containing protein [Spirochaetales bacterium]|nr:DUF4387 domain-containing protein [Spirochaetales bacterium]
MSRLSDSAEVFRSKNAGPFLLTIDIMFRERERYDAVKRSGALDPHKIAARYGVREQQVRIHYADRIRTVKITMPRSGAGSGAPGDRDVYGAQQHGALLDLEIPDTPSTGATG